MKWIELTVDVPPEYAEPMSEIFHRYGHGGVAIEQEAGHNPDEGESPPVPDFVTVKTYLPIDNTTERRKNQIDVGVRLVAHLATISPLREQYVEEEDWQNAWKEHFDPLRIGQHLVICPTWREVETTEFDPALLDLLKVTNKTLEEVENELPRATEEAADLMQI